MSPDPVVAEIRRVREEFAARFGYDLSAIVKYAQERDAASDREVIRRPPRQPAAAVKAKSLPQVASATDGS
jgi:hypothetical protein